MAGGDHKHGRNRKRYTPGATNGKVKGGHHGTPNLAGRQRMSIMPIVTNTTGGRDSDPVGDINEHAHVAHFIAINRMDIAGAQAIMWNLLPWAVRSLTLSRRETQDKKRKLSHG